MAQEDDFLLLLDSTDQYLEHLKSYVRGIKGSIERGEWKGKPEELKELYDKVANVAESIRDVPPAFKQKAKLRVGTIQNAARGPFTAVQVEFPDGYRVNMQLTQKGPMGKPAGWVSVSPGELERDKDASIELAPAEVWLEGTGFSFEINS